jgi:hypothetical protein
MSAAGAASTRTWPRCGPAMWITYGAEPFGARSRCSSCARVFARSVL